MPVEAGSVMMLDPEFWDMQDAMLLMGKRDPRTRKGKVGLDFADLQTS